MNLRSLLEQRLGTAYRVERELGGGGMSHVFLAEEVALGRRVVVKVLPPDAISGVDAERFRREIQLAASLQHPHIVPLLSAGHADDLLWYTMPYVEGETLRARLAREHELPVATAVKVWRELLDSLSYAHGRGVVHRDIKPENILASGRHVVVTDFGVAKALSAATGGATMTGIGLALGTPAYMAPEQATADPALDHRADLYAAGLVMYEMLAGRAPFEGLTSAQLLAAHATRIPEGVQVLRPAAPAPLAALVMRCLEKRAADRPQNADEVLAALDTIVTPSATSAGTSPAATASQPPAPSAHPRPRRRTVALVALVFAALTATGVLASRDRAPARIGADPSDSTVRSVAIPRFAADPLDSTLAAEATEILRASVLRSSRLFTLTQANEAQLERWAFDLAEGERAHPDSLARVLTHQGFHVVVRGRITRVGSSRQVTVEMLPTAAGSAPLEPITATARDSGALVTTISDVATRVARALERAASQLRRPPVYALATSSSLEALRVYQEASDLAYGQVGDQGAALRLFRQAVTIDPHFAPAWRRLGGLLWNSGIRRAESMHAATRSYEERARVRSWERSLIEGSYFQRLNDQDASIAALAPAVAQGDGNAIHNTAVMYHFSGRHEIALRFLERNAAGATTYGNGGLQLASVLMELGRREEAERVVAWGDSVSPGNAFLYETRARLLVAKREYDTLRFWVSDSAWLPTLPMASSIRRVILRRARALEAINGRLAAVRQQSENLATTSLAFESPADALRDRIEGIEMEASAGVDAAPLAERLRGLLREQPLSGFEPLDRPYAALFSAWSALGQSQEAARILTDWDRDLTGRYSKIDAVERAVARGDLALARRDGRAALTAYAASRQTVCPKCYLPRVARAYETRRMADSAIVAYEGFLTATNPYQDFVDPLELARTFRRLGELYDEKGDAARAITRYESFVKLWKDADPELRPQVERVRARIAELRRRSG